MLCVARRRREETVPSRPYRVPGARRSPSCCFHLPCGRLEPAVRTGITRGLQRGLQWDYAGVCSGITRGLQRDYAGVCSGITPGSAAGLRGDLHVHGRGGAGPMRHDDGRELAAEIGLARGRGRVSKRSGQQHHASLTLTLTPGPTPNAYP